MNATRLSTILSCLFFLCACVPAEGPEAAGERGDGPGHSGDAPGVSVDRIHELPPPTDHVASDGERVSEGEVELSPDPSERPRHLRRMSIDQLKASIAAVTDGLFWGAGRNTDEFDRLAGTLGVPNYLDTTNEDLDASMVFQKFLGDAMHSVCHEAIENDRQMAIEDRIMVRFVEVGVGWEGADDQTRDAIDRNLRYMKLRITGHYVAPGDEAGLARLRWLFRSVTLSTGDANRGWRAVCVGLMSSPEFYLY